MLLAQQRHAALCFRVHQNYSKKKRAITPTESPVIVCAFRVPGVAIEMLSVSISVENDSFDQQECVFN